MTGVQTCALPISHKRIDGFSGETSPGTEALGKRSDGSERHCAQFMVPETAKKIVGNRYFVPFAREIEGRGPSTITIASQNQYSHGTVSSPSRHGKITTLTKAK